MVFLDTNILLEIILVNRPCYAQVKHFLEMTREETAISPLTIHLVMYFGRKEQADDAFLHATLNQNALLSLTPQDYEWATNHEQGRDFEDALQVAMAIRSGCTSFVTLDTALAKRHVGLPIEIVVPS